MDKVIVTRNLLSTDPIAINELFALPIDALRLCFSVTQNAESLVLSVISIIVPSHHGAY